MDPLEEQTLEARIAWKGDFLEVHQDRVRAPDGHEGTREYLTHPGAVMVVPLLDDDRLVLERQYRYPLRRSFVELPAGKIDPGEALIDCARRELLEETGYAAAQWTYLGGFHNAIGYCNEKIEVFLARELTYQGAQADAGEVLEIFTLPWRDVLAEVCAGRITDVKTIVGVLWLEKYLSGQWPGAGAA